MTATEAEATDEWRNGAYCLVPLGSFSPFSSIAQDLMSRGAGITPD